MHKSDGRELVLVAESIRFDSRAQGRGGSKNALLYSPNCQAFTRGIWRPLLVEESGSTQSGAVRRCGIDMSPRAEAVSRLLSLDCYCRYGLLIEQGYRCLSSRGAARSPGLASLSTPCGLLRGNTGDSTSALSLR